MVALLKRIKTRLLQGETLTIDDVNTEVEAVKGEQIRIPGRPTLMQVLGLGGNVEAEELFGSFEIDVPEQAVRQLASLTLDDIDNMLNLQVDAVSCLRPSRLLLPAHSLRTIVRAGHPDARW